MTTFELAKLVYETGCELSISPSEVCNAVYVIAKNKNNEKTSTNGFAMESSFSDLQETLDFIIKMSIHQVK